MVFQFYRTKEIGTGGSVTVDDPVKGRVTRVDSKRCALDRYISNDGTGQNFWDFICDSRPIRYALAVADESKFALLAKDTDVLQISPVCNGLAELQAWLDSPLDSFLAFVFETDGFVVDGAVTNRHAWRMVAMMHAVFQRMRQTKNTDCLQVFSKTSETETVALSATELTAVSQFFSSQSIDGAKLERATTLRQVSQELLTSKEWPSLELGPVRF